MYKNFYHQKILLLCFVVLIFNYNNTFGAINEVTCNSDFSSDCNQCFKSDSNLYLGYLRKDLSDIWSSTDGEYLYEDENTSPVSLNPFYKNGELTRGPGNFIYSPGLTDKNTSNGEFFKDSKGDPYIDFNAGARGEIVKSDSNFFIKFDKLSEEIKSNGRNKPLLEFKYVFNYRSKKDVKNKKVHTECIFKYPAWCGDGVFDSGKEECEYNAKPGQPGYNPKCTQECKIPTGPSVCERGNIVLPLTSEINQNTPGLCKDGEVVGDFRGDIVGSIINYSWSCNGKSGGSCGTDYNSNSNPSCGNLTGYPTGTVDIGTISNLNCSGINGKDDTGYKIEVQKDGGSFTSITGTLNNNNNYTAQYKFSLPGKYNFRCLVGNETTPRDSCKNNNEIKVELPFCGDGIKNGTETCDYNDITKSGWQNGNYCSTSCDYSTSSCINGGIQHNLSSPIDQNSAGLCRSGETVSGFTSSPASTSPVNYSWSCNGNSGGNCSSVYSFGGPPHTYCGNGSIDPGELCDFNDTYYRNGWQNGNYCSANCDYGSSGGGGGGGAFCGNGIIEGNEQCEAEYKNGKLEFWNGCNKYCQFGIDIFTNPGSCTGPRICPSTIPAGGTIDFGPNGNIIIGHESNAFQDYLEKPYVINNTKHELGGFEKLCVKHTNGNNISYPTSYGSDGKICIDMPRVFVPGQKIEFYNSPEFKGNKDTIGLYNYGDNILTTTIQAIDKSTGISKLYENAYFAAKLNVRVSRPSISTVGGGTSYVSDSSKVADLNKITEGRGLDNNKNFVGTSVGSGQISSYSQSITKIDKENKISNSYSGSINNNNSKNTTLITPSSDFTKFKSYNGLSDVFIIKDTNFTIDNVSFINNLKQPTTFIIDNGDLRITKDIKFKDYNIAFIVKGAGKDIIIADSVSEINGTYITIGGKFRGDSSKVQLKVYGSLYGDISSLIDNRYYIKQNSNGQIDVGTIISFGSSIFRKTAPLTGEFIGEYLKSNKIAQ